jgi:hypothetical protein
MKRQDVLNKDKYLNAKGFVKKKLKQQMVLLDGVSAPET